MIKKLSHKNDLQGNIKLNIHVELLSTKVSISNYTFDHYKNF